MTRTLDLFLHYLRSKNPLFIPDHPNRSANLDDQNLGPVFTLPDDIPDHPNGSANIDDQNLGPVFTLPEEQEPLVHS